MSTFEYNVEQKYYNERIDKYLSAMLQDKTRSYLQKVIKDQLVTANSLVVRSSYKVQVGDNIKLELPADIPLDVLPQNIPLDILYEDEDVLIVNKPKGMVVHPSAGHYQDTLVNAILYHCKDNLSGINGVLRPGIVHRIDMDTTGVLVVCKNNISHQSLANQLKEHSITRRYRAIVYGIIKEDGTVSAPISRHPIDRKKMAINTSNGKNATTHYRILETFDKFTYIECSLETGRTHQIRVHLSSIGHPLLGDCIYGSNKNTFKLQGQTLHAMTLGFIHPRTNQYVEFQSPLPGYFQNLLDKLRK